MFPCAKQYGKIIDNLSAGAVGIKCTPQAIFLSSVFNEILSGSTVAIGVKKVKLGIDGIADRKFCCCLYLIGSSC